MPAGSPSAAHARPGSDRLLYYLWRAYASFTFSVPQLALLCRGLNASPAGSLIANCVRVRLPQTPIRRALVAYSALLGRGADWAAGPTWPQSLATKLGCYSRDESPTASWQASAAPAPAGHAGDEATAPRRAVSRTSRRMATWQRLSPLTRSGPARPAGTGGCRCHVNPVQHVASGRSLRQSRLARAAGPNQSGPFQQGPLARQ